MCSRCQNDITINPNWDALLTDEDKERLRGVEMSIDIRRMDAEDAKKIVEIVKEMFDEKED